MARTRLYTMMAAMGNGGENMLIFFWMLEYVNRHSVVSYMGILYFQESSPSFTYQRNRKEAAHVSHKQLSSAPDGCLFILFTSWGKEMKVWAANPQIFIPLSPFRPGQLDGRAQSSALHPCLALPSSAVQPGMTLAELCLHFHVCAKSVCHHPVGFSFLLFKVSWPLLLKRARLCSPWFPQVHGIKAGCLGGTGSLLWRARCCWRCTTGWSVYILGF